MGNLESSDQPQPSRFLPRLTFQINMEKLFKIIIIGDPTVGKTAFTNRYVNDVFHRDYKGTIGVDFALKVVHWSDQLSIKLQLWDIAGQERFTSMTRVYYKDARACIIMFDITQRSTFSSALKWKNDLDSKCTLPDGSAVPCILLANKCDLNMREVNQQEIENFSHEHGFIGWTETSVKEGLMIEESMKFLLEKVMENCDDIEDSDEVEGAERISLSRNQNSAPERQSRTCFC